MKNGEYRLHLVGKSRWETIPDSCLLNANEVGICSAPKKRPSRPINSHFRHTVSRGEVSGLPAIRSSG